MARQIPSLGTEMSTDSHSPVPMHQSPAEPAPSDARLWHTGDYRPGRKLRINWILAAANMSGGTKSNRLIAEAMIRRGHQVTIAFPRGGPRPWPRLSQPRRFLQRVGRELSLVGRQKHHLEHSTARLVPTAGRPVRAQDVPDADVTIATWWETMEWIRDWPTSKGIHAYFIRHYETHGGDPDRVRATYRYPAIKLVIAKWLRDLMADEFDDPSAVLVPNGVDWSQFDSVPRERSSRPTVGMYYGPQQWKGCDTAAAAIRHVQRRIPGVRVVAFGSTPLHRHWQAPANLEYHLRPPQHVIPSIYQSTDCWIVSSTLEGFGMPGLEAAACHCPLVSTRCGGPEDYVEDSVNGRLVDVGDAEAMAEAILSVLRLEDAAWRRMSRASHLIARRFDWDRSAGILEGALLDAVARRESGSE